MKYENLYELIVDVQYSSGLEIKTVWMTLKNYTELMASVTAQSSAIFTVNGFMLCGVIVKIDQKLADDPGYFIEYTK